jgi:transposase
VHDDGSAATAMLGLAGFVLLAVSAYAGEVEQAVETTSAEDFCRGCGVQARLHGRRPTWVRDLPSAGRPTTLVWVKRVWRCVESACPVTTWSETSEHIRPRASLTVRARREVCRRVGEDGHSVAQVAAAFGVGWGTAMAAVRAYGSPLVEDAERLGGVAELGVDETAFLAANATHPTLFVTAVVDLRAPRGSTSWKAAAERPCPTGCLPAPRAGGTVCGRRRWTPTAATPPRCAPASLRRPGCSTPSM